MRRVSIDRAGTTVSCLDSETGDDVVVLLHGLAGSAREMLPTAEALLPEHRVIAVDQRGHGHSTRRPGDVSRRAYTDDVAAVVDRLAGRPVTLVGQSMGGHTAMLTAAWHPGLVKRLVMLEAGVGGEGDPAELGAWFASWPVPFPDVEAAAAFLGPKPITGAWLQDLERHPDGLRPRFDADIMQAAIAEVAARPRWDEWASVTVPTLLVTAEKGMDTDAEVRRMLELRPAAGHVVVPDCGHDVHLERPRLWTSLLADWLADQK
ncbi:MAG TPA: alpha/beta hydrolase [Actinoplanes sp.]|nr:alpha/beta hydrolase [Actinoplanes sp.]